MLPADICRCQGLTPDRRDLCKDRTRCFWFLALHAGAYGIGPRYVSCAPTFRTNPDGECPGFMKTEEKKEMSDIVEQARAMNQSLASAHPFEAALSAGYCCQIVDRLLAHVSEQSARIVALEASLPKTKDGEVIHVGLRLWRKRPIGCDRVVTVQVFGEANVLVRCRMGDSYAFHAHLYRRHPDTGLTPEEAEK